MKAGEIEAIVEAVLFVAPDPVPLDGLQELFAKGDRDKVLPALETVRQRYQADATDRGVFLEEVAGGYRLVTRPELNDYLESFFQARVRSRLSMAALETLTIIAYRQPVTGPEIQELRGVHSGGVLKTLLDRGLIRVAGRKQVVGKPFLYRTTKEFLQHFGLASIVDLPPLEEFEENFGSLETQQMVAEIQSRDRELDDPQAILPSDEHGADPQAAGSDLADSDNAGGDYVEEKVDD